MNYFNQFGIANIYYTGNSFHYEIWKMYNKISGYFII